MYCLLYDGNHLFSENKALQKEAMAFTFQLKSVKNIKEARPIQLRVFKRRSRDRNPHDMYFIHLYQSHEFISNVSFITNKSLSTRLIGTRFVRNSRGEWLTFDVTSAILSKLVRQTEINFFIEVKSVKYLSDSKPISIAKGGRKLPFILIYFPLPLQKLSKAAMGGHTKKNSNNFPLRTSSLTRFPRSLSSSLCSRKSMTINFQQLGYSSILHPQTYNAHTCAGICPAFSGSKHQKIYIFLRNRHLGKGGCCIPTEFEPLSILYYSEPRKITISRFPGMIVTSCGCT